MKFAIEVGGKSEKHLLEYEFNEWMGRLVIKVDNQEVKRSKCWFRGSRKEAYDLVLGEREPLNIRIEKEWRFFFGQKNRVFVNDRLIRCFEG
jgi:hypothetical protein